MPSHNPNVFPPHGHAALSGIFQPPTTSTINVVANSTASTASSPIPPPAVSTVLPDSLISLFTAANLAASQKPTYPPLGTATLPLPFVPQLPCDANPRNSEAEPARIAPLNATPSPPSAPAYNLFATLPLQQELRKLLPRPSFNGDHKKRRDFVCEWELWWSIAHYPVEYKALTLISCLPSDDQEICHVRLTKFGHNALPARRGSPCLSRRRPLEY